jgi:hypothetical protein
MSAGHSRFAPSSLSRVVACPGSYSLAAQYPDSEDTPEAREGTAAHWVASEALFGRWHEVGELAPNGVAVTDEMVEGAELWHQNLHMWNGGQERIEAKLSCPHIHPECWGTPDFSILYQQAERMIVADYKFGHRHVEAFENWQLIAYASGMMQYWNGPDDLEIVLKIIQPRAYHRDGPVRDWKTTPAELRPYWDQLKIVCLDAEEGETSACLVSGECRYCPARHACEAAHSAALSAMDLAGTTTPLELNANALSLELRMAKRSAMLLESRISGLEEQALSRIKNGDSVPGFSLQAGVGRERWSKPIGEVISLGTAFGVDISKLGVATPKQAVKAGIPRDVVTAYSETPSGEIKLVPSDERKLRSIFKMR